MIKTSLPRLIACAALLAASAVPLNLHAQTPARPPAEGDFTKLVLTLEEQDVDPEDIVEIEVARDLPDWQAETGELVEQFIKFYQGRGRPTMEAGLRRITSQPKSWRG